MPSRSDLRDVAPLDPAARTILALTVAVSLWLGLRHNDFPVGFHPDERSKAIQVERQRFNFRHPLLMLQTVRLAAPLADAVGSVTAGPAATRPAATGTAATVRLGRTVVAVTAATAVVVAFLLFRLLAGTAVALLGAALFAFSPSLVIHAHYFKEDVHLTLCLLLALLAWVTWQRAPSRGRLVLLGVATGLACSAKAVGALLFVAYALAPLVVRPPSARQWYRGLALVAAIAAAVFVAVNYPMFAQSESFRSGFTAEARHGVQGHLLRIWPLGQWFTYHLRKSIVPGSGAVLTALAFGSLAALAVALARGRRVTRAGERILLLFAAVYFLAIELSPTKPFGGSMRYALPLLPMVGYAAARGLAALASAAGRRGGPVVAGPVLAGLGAVVLAFPAAESWRLVEHLRPDTREIAERFLQGEQGARILRERHTGRSFDLKVLGRRSVPALLASDYDFAVVSSLTYERYSFGAGLGGQRPAVERIARNYGELFECPYREFAPAHVTYALSNPTVRIVDLRSCRRLRGGAAPAAIGPDPPP